MQLARRIVDLVALAQRIEAVALTGMHLPGEHQRIQHRTQVVDGGTAGLVAGELVVEEADVEGRVMDDQLGFADETDELLGDVGEQRLVRQELRRQPVDLLGAGIDLPLRVQILVEGAPGRPAVHQLDAADLDDPVPLLGLQACRFSIQYDLSHA